MLPDTSAPQEKRQFLSGLPLAGWNFQIPPQSRGPVTSATPAAS